MLDFKTLKVAIKTQFDKMKKHPLFKTDVSKDEMWEVYLGSFPEGTNPLIKERTEHDCQACRQFIRTVGNVVAIIKNKKVSIWDVENEDYQSVINAMASLVKSRDIRDEFLHDVKNVGIDQNHQILDDGSIITYDHFYCDLPDRVVKKKDEIDTMLDASRSSKDVLKRGLEEISVDSLEIVLELIDQNSIYRGEEHKEMVENFTRVKRKYDKLKSEQKDIFAWVVASEDIAVSRFRNSVIGTLLVDISEGKDLDKAVQAFENKVAPTNYKRPSAIVTKKMISNAEKKVKELGLESALPRRYATINDITINNIIYADRTAKKEMNVFEALSNEVVSKPSEFKRVEEVSVETFLSDIVPKSESIEVQFENRHENNLMSLVAPVNEDVNPLFKWGNNFSWTYKGELADSLKERVKKAGGSVDGVLRFSIQWNDGDNNENDFDAHCIEPDGNHIYFSNKGHRHKSSGMLDVDIVNPNREVAVENITWSHKSKMNEGNYKFFVNNFTHRGGKTGFSAEIEYDGKIYSYFYDKELRQGENVVVAEIKFSNKNGIKFVKSLPYVDVTKELWGINTNTFHKVRVIMNSPNHWDGEETGNKHWFFILDNCVNPDKCRGFYNEFLKGDLTKHRKVFEVLGSKMRANYSEDQLSGLGFSSTSRNSILCKVVGKCSRVIQVNF